MPATSDSPFVGVLLIAHAPLASALRACALHVLPDCDHAVAALDVQANASPEASAQAAMAAMASLGTDQILVLTDVFGATPSNVAKALVATPSGSARARLLAGVNLPMLVRALNYRTEPLESVANRAMAGATAGIISVAQTAPQNQTRIPTLNPNDPHHHHQQ